MLLFIIKQQTKFGSFLGQIEAVLYSFSIFSAVVCSNFHAAFSYAPMYSIFINESSLIFFYCIIFFVIFLKGRIHFRTWNLTSNEGSRNCLIVSSPVQQTTVVSWVLRALKNFFFMISIKQYTMEVCSENKTPHSKNRIE